MTRELRLAPITIVGLTVVSVGLAWYAFMSGSVPADRDEPPGLDASSIDLATGTREGTISAYGMVPGDAITAAVTVANSGREPMTYVMRRGLISAGGTQLASALVLTIKTVGSSCADFDGTTLFDGPLDEAAFGSEGTGHPLPAATAEILCFRVALPADTPDALQGAATTVALSFRGSSQAAVR
jgi:hypothetical protein